MVSSKCYPDPQPLWTIHMLKHNLSAVELDNGLLWICTSCGQAAAILREVVNIPLLVSMNN